MFGAVLAELKYTHSALVSSFVSFEVLNCTAPQWAKEFMILQLRIIFVQC